MSASLEFLAAGGRVGELMRAHDWSSSPLGAPDTWPAPLCTVVSLLLQSKFPMFVAWGRELGFLYNDPYAEILGAKHPGALGARFHDIWAEIWPDISPLIDAAMSGEGTYHQDLPLVMNRKGFDEQTWFTFSYSPVRDDSGKAAGVFCACFETTETILTGRALRESESRLRELNETLERRVTEALAERKLLADIVEGTNALVLVADLDGRWLALNRAAADEYEAVFGIRPKTGDSVFDGLAMGSAHRAEVETMWGRALAGEEFATIGEFGDPMRDRRFYEIRFSNLRDRDGRIVGAYQFAAEMTQRVRDQERLRTAEDALRQAQKMESIGQLTGGVAHDFNNLLAVFATGLQLLDMEITAEQRQRTLDGMKRAVTRGTGLTRHLLAFSRRRPINPESIRLDTQLKGMRAMFDGALGAAIEIAMRFEDQLWPVEIDAGELELAILNLCVNARDAMSDGGVITITAENVREQNAPGHYRDYVKLAIGDTGSGMTEDVMARAFEPFFTTKDVSKGSGLGLTQVYGFVQQSGGRVAIDSTVGDGTTVTVLLPRSISEPAAAQEEHAAAVAPLGNGAHLVTSARLLLVEDDAEVSAVTREMLTMLGFTVVHAANGPAALAALADDPAIDMVLSDIMMPGGINGLELARSIRKSYPTLPITLATGYVDSAAGIADGEFPLLVKPYGLDALAGALGIKRPS